jgi:hypothetical protein
MMGLEPTTFCMANGPWNEVGERRKPHGQAENGALPHSAGGAQITVVSGRFRPIWAQEPGLCPIRARESGGQLHAPPNCAVTGNEVTSEVDGQRPLQLRVRMKGLHERRPVTPEVAGSSPVAPVS